MKMKTRTAAAFEALGNSIVFLSAQPQRAIPPKAALHAMKPLLPIVQRQNDHATTGIVQGSRRSHPAPSSRTATRTPAKAGVLATKTLSPIARLQNKPLSYSLPSTLHPMSTTSRRQIGLRHASSFEESDAIATGIVSSSGRFNFAASGRTSTLPPPQAKRR